MIGPDRHTFSLLVANKPGVLMRIAQVFARRGFNIDSLVVSPTADATLSRMTITAGGEPMALEQIVLQVSKLVDVVHATDHSRGLAVEKEMALIKVRCSASTRTEILQLAGHFKAQTADFQESYLVLSASGNPEKLDAFISMLARYGIIELARSGRILMARGEEST